MIYVWSFQLTMHIAFEGFDLINHDIDVGFIIKTLNLKSWTTWSIMHANQCQNQKAYINTNNIIKNSCIMILFFHRDGGQQFKKLSLNNNFTRLRAISLNNNKKLNNLHNF